MRGIQRQPSGGQARAAVSVFVGVLALILFSAGCGPTASPSPSAGAAEPVPQSSPTVLPTVESAPDPDATPAETPNTANTPETTESEAEPAPSAEVSATPEPPIDAAEEVLVASFPAMTLLTPGAGGGTRPLLSWEPVDGASYYTVTLFAPSGRPYWASVVIETETYVGGPVQIGEDKPGPRVIDGMTWMVVAYDEIQAPVALSGKRTVAP